MLDIDGSHGGGQLLRTALTVSALTGEAIHIRDIRGSRSTPGLKAQHDAAVTALASICSADVTDHSVGARDLTFRPTTLRSGVYDIDIGTAGSVFLVFDTLLPLASAINEPLVVTVHGGTDTKWAPTSLYYRHVKLPLLRRFGLQAQVSISRHGFYPQGGATATLALYPSALSPIQLTKQEPIEHCRVYSLATDDLLQADVAERQCNTICDGLTSREISIVERHTTYVAACSPGSSVTIRADGHGSICGFSHVGEKGKPAETVAKACLHDLDQFLAQSGAVDSHTTDQLLPFLALTGGQLVLGQTTSHIDTLLKLFDWLGFDMTVENRNSERCIQSDGMD